METLHPPQPDLSVVVVTAGTFRNVRRTVAYLQDQTVASRLELIVVAASERALDDMQPESVAGFARVEFVYTPLAALNVDKASAAGVHRVTAAAVALIEDHAYPEPHWAERTIERHREDWAVVGPLVINANPTSMLSWTNLLIAYGPSTEPNVSGERDALPGHNLAYKTHLLKAYGERLVDKLGRTGGLLEELLDRGERLYLESGARLAHANPSRLAPTMQLRFCSGRLYGHTRATENDWTPLHRVLYVAGGLLIPLVRLPRFREEFFAQGKRCQIVPRIYPALLFGLLLDALGQMAGYALGPGTSAEVLAVFEMDRMQHLNSADRAKLA
jgi:hypothetical protein